MNIIKDIQRSFFDSSEHQYNQDLILNPPLHCVVEYEYIRTAITAPFTPGVKMRVADYGAGSGRMTIPSLQAGYQVTAVDISPKSLSNLQKVAKDMNLKNLTVAKELPHKETFDAIIGADVLHHVDIDRELPTLYKGIKKGGVIAFSEPSAYNIAWYLYLPFASSWSVEQGMLQCRAGNLITLCKKHGFKNVKIVGMGLLPTPIFNKWSVLCRLNYTLGNLPLIKLFAYRYLLVASK